VAKSYQILETLIDSIKQIVNLQASRFEELSSKDYPYNSSKEHIKIMREIYHQALKIVKEFEDDFKNAKKDDDYIELEKDLKQISQTLTWIGGIAINIISSSTRENVSQNTIFLVKYLTSPFVKSSRFILIPIDQHNYEITRWGSLLQSLINLMEIDPSVLTYAPNSFSILSFPVVYKDNLVAHSLLGHEIGHFIIWYKSLEKQFNSVIKFGGNNIELLVNQEIEKKKTEQKRELSVAVEEEIRNQIQQEIRSNVSAGTEELLCDLIGFRIMGPVILFSLAEFLLSDTYAYKIFQKYPPPALRLQVLIDEINTGDYLKKINDGEVRAIVQKLIDNIQNFITPENISQYNLKEKIQYESWKNVIPNLKKIADQEINKIPELQYSAKTFGSDMPPLIQKLKKFIPPCEIEQGIAADLISILNAGMIFKLSWKKILPSLPPKTKQKIESTLDALVIRAVQQSEIEKELQNAQKIAIL